MEFNIPNEFNLNGNIADHFETFIEEFSNCFVATNTYIENKSEKQKVLSITLTNWEGIVCQPNM